MSSTKVGTKKATSSKKALSRAQKKRRKKAQLAAAQGQAAVKKTGKDAIFHTIFGNPTYFMMFLKDFVNEKWVKTLEEKHLLLLPTKYTRLLKGRRESDVVYEINHPEYQGYFIVLTEHQSSVDHMMPLRVLDYLVCIWWAWLKNRKPLLNWETTPFKLPPILPIVFFDGLEDWTVPTKFENKVAFSEEFARWIPKFEYLLVDLNTISFEHLESLEDSLALCLMLDKCTNLEEFLHLQKAKASFRENLLKALEHTPVREVLTQVFEAFAENAKLPRETAAGWLEDYLKGKDPVMFQRIEEGRKREMLEYAQKIVDARLDGEKNGRNLGARDEKISLLSKQFAKKFRISPSAIEDIIVSQSNETLDNLGESIFSIESIEELKGYLKQQ